MTTIMKLLEFGFEVDVGPLYTYNHGQLANRELSTSHETLFTIKFNSFPSKYSVRYDSSRYIDLLTILKDNGFKIFAIFDNPGGFPSKGMLFIDTTNDIMVHLDPKKDGLVKEDDDEKEDDPIMDTCVIHYSLKTRQKMEKFFSQLEELNIPQKLDSENDILLFEKNMFGDLVLKPHKINPYDIDISKNYNDDFIDIDSRMKSWVKDFSIRNNKLVLFNGDPGTGKTNYIKYLLSNTPNIKKIFIPPYFIQSMSDPAFLPVIRAQKNSLLIIEDAEKILVKREEQLDNSIVSLLLNLCDGIMADILNFKIIATFNTDVNSIDDALTRQGRMFLHYKFGKLKNDKARKLFKDVHGTELDSKDDLTLSEIYNEKNRFSKKETERRIGFLT